MSKLPDYEPQLLIPGPYRFTVSDEPEVRKNDKGNRFVIFKFKAADPVGHLRSFRDLFLPGEDRYQQLLLALGGVKGQGGRVHIDEMEDIIGKAFDAEIIHVPDRTDKTIIRDKITNIRVDVPANVEGDGDIPF